MTLPPSTGQSAPSWATVLQRRAASTKEALAPEHQSDPIAFARDALGLTPWHGMNAILSAVAANDRVAVRAGRKVSKTASGAAAALWWALKGGKVLVTAPSAATLEDPFWLELDRLAQRVNIHVPARPTTPITTRAGGRIIGRQAAKRENLQGPSGTESLYIIEESSGVRRDIFEAIEGNVGGGGKILMLGNPTMLSGVFYDAFTPGSEWTQIHISSRESPNVTNPNTGIPGLAVPTWIAEMERKHGKESAFVAIHVDGDFPTSGADAIVPLATILKAQEAWTPTPPTTGRLTIGVDVARSGNDASVIQPVRGTHAYPPETHRNQTGPTLGQHTLRAATNLRHKDEPVTINIDIIGVGASVYDWLTSNAPDWATINGINVAENATNPNYRLLRDQLAFTVTDWLLDAGTLPPHDELRGDLAAGTFTFDTRGRYVTASKDQLRETLSRSPDHGDALALALYTPPPPLTPHPPLGWE